MTEPRNPDRLSESEEGSCPVMLFLDCEFTHFVRPQLISIGLVDASGERCFYGVVEDFDRGACSDFVRETVLAKLHARFPACEKAAGGVFRRSDMGKVLLDWLAAQRPASGSLVVAFDYYSDGDLLAELLPGGVPPWISLENIGDKVEWVEEEGAEHPLRHHALFDALRLRQQFEEAERQVWGD